LTANRRPHRGPRSWSGRIHAGTPLPHSGSGQIVYMSSIQLASLLNPQESRPARRRMPWHDLGRIFGRTASLARVEASLRVFRRCLREGGLGCFTLANPGHGSEAVASSMVGVVVFLRLALARTRWRAGTVGSLPQDEAARQGACIRMACNGSEQEGL
jgi:hypothetical protein